MNYILSKRKPEVGDRGFIIGNRFIPIQKSNKIYGPNEGLVFYASLESLKTITGRLQFYGNPVFMKNNNVPCVYLDGNSYLYSTNFNELPNGKSSATISVWFNQASGTGLKGVFGYGEYNGSKGRHILTKWDDIYSCGFNNDRTYNYSLNYNQWYHVCFVHENNQEKCYVNGSIIGQNNFSFNIGNQYLEIGKHDAISLNRLFKGYIASARIYNRALEDSQIVQLSKEFKF